MLSRRKKGESKKKKKCLKLCQKLIGELYLVFLFLIFLFVFSLFYEVSDQKKNCVFNCFLFFFFF